MKSRFREGKTVSILREAQGVTRVKNVCARHNISDQTYCGWKRRYGGMQVDEVRQATCAGRGEREAQAHCGGPDRADRHLDQITS